MIYLPLSGHGMKTVESTLRYARLHGGRFRFCAPRAVPGLHAALFNMRRGTASSNG